MPRTGSTHRESTVLVLPSNHTKRGANEQGKTSTHRYQYTQRMSPSTTVRVGMYCILPTRVLNVAQSKEDTARADMCESEHQSL